MKWTRIQSQGFTLIELLVVGAIIAILVAMILPAVSQVRERSRRITCASNMHHIGVAFALYSEDHQGKYPYSWQPDPGPPPNPGAGNSNNWQSFLCAPSLGGTYLPDDWLSWKPPPYFAIRWKSVFLCPTMVLNLRNQGVDMDYHAPPNEILNHDHWGYCYNAYRSDLTWAASAAPWSTPNLGGCDERAIYEAGAARYAILTDGDAANWNADNDENAFTQGNPNECLIAPVHGDLINVLFLDGHVEGMKTDTPARKTAFNQAWYGGVPVPSNTYATY